MCWKVPIEMMFNPMSFNDHFRNVCSYNEKRYKNWNLECQLEQIKELILERKIRRQKDNSGRIKAEKYSHIETISKKREVDNCLGC